MMRDVGDPGDAPTPPLSTRIPKDLPDPSQESLPYPGTPQLGL
jgi:hypothetical protein